MEGDTQGVEPAEPPSDTTYSKDEWISDWLDELCPYYMFLGVSCEDFWHGDYTKLRYFVNKHMLEIEQRNQEYFVLSVYIGEHFDTTLANAFKEKGTPKREYRQEPIRLTPMTDAEIREKERIESKKLRDSLSVWADRFNRTMEQKNGARE